MSNSIKDYRDLIDKPWGKMFYDMIYKQLNISNHKSLDILDFGAGFCVTANYYAKYHNVTAVEPNDEMIKFRIKDNKYTLIRKGSDALSEIDDDTFDVICCHNVLEYAENRRELLYEFSRILKPGGTLSIVKHNLYGRIISEAVLNNNPKSALDLLDVEFDGADNMFGKRDTYTNEFLINELLKYGVSLNKILGIRTFFGLSSNSKIKFDDNWYESMLDLEMKACKKDEFKNISFFNHLIFDKDNV